MSILKPQSFDIAHYYATRPKYKYYNSNLLRMFLSDAKEWKPLRPMPAPEEAHIIPAKSSTKEHRFYLLERIMLLGHE